MAIRTKPQQIAVEERRVDALIEKGGSVAAHTEAAHTDRVKLQLLQLRLLPELVERIDHTRKMRSVPPSRHAWILEAIMDKLQPNQ